MELHEKIRILDDFIKILEQIKKDMVRCFLKINPHKEDIVKGN